jgi:hypothetical protein
MRVLSDASNGAAGGASAGWLPAGNWRLAPNPAPRCYELVTVTVGSKEALTVRRALAGCADTSVVSCSPWPRDDKVRLQVRFPAGRADQVMRRVLAGVPSGEFGRIVGYVRPLVRRVPLPEVGS